jgi:hypothetical protein
MFFAWLFLFIGGIVLIYVGKQNFKYGRDGAIPLLMGWGLIIFDVIVGFSLMSL